MSSTSDPADLMAADDMEALHAELVASNPPFARAWAASAAKRSVALALVGLRREAKLTQAEVAARAGWDKGFVSRLESALGPVPNTATLSRYAQACGATANVAFAIGDRVVDVVRLAAEEPRAAGITG